MTTPIEYATIDEGRHVNYWTFDRTLQREVERVYPSDALAWASDRLESFGELVGHTIADNADAIDRHGPQLHTYDADGEIQNEVEYHPLQFENERLVYEAGIVADCFHPPPGRDDPMPFSHNLAMQYLLSYADPGFDCPVAMTVGVALVLERFGDASLDPYLRRLTSRDYDDLIEGAMFLTEKQGGSDVGANETKAVFDEASGHWHLHGEKWFCSNIDAQGTLALARMPDAPEGTAGLSMFLVPHRLPDGSLNDQRYRRLKDKLGTISVPTGEVELTGARGYLVGTEHEGFKQMAEMLNLERLSNAAASCGIMGRALLESKVHAAHRRAFGRTLDEHPLMRVDLVDLAVDHEAATTFTFEAARRFSNRETARRHGASAETDYRIMRVLIPVAKARTARMAVETASYAMEIQGGNGYVRDFVTHRLLRDAQVLPIWEGTENILSLDVLRAFEREASHIALLEWLDGTLGDIEASALSELVSTVRDERRALEHAMAAIEGERAGAERVAKRLLHRIFDVVTATLLLERAADGLTTDDDARDAVVAERFIDRELRPDGSVFESTDRFAERYFDAIVRFDHLEPEALVAPDARVG
ncbi:MAG: acyl-CoA dehydrogenase family protein [Halobacteriota archaeon]